MMISSLRYLVQDRKGKLTTYLNNNTEEIPLEKQHQLYGAIQELESITEVLLQTRGKEIQKSKNPEDIFLFKPIHSKGFFRELKDFVSDLF